MTTAGVPKGALAFLRAQAQALAKRGQVGRQLGDVVEARAGTFERADVGQGVGDDDAAQSCRPRACSPRGESSTTMQRSAASEALPDAQRDAITLLLEGLSYREIGERLGITDKATSVRITRARKALRRQFAGG